jgi:predicted RNase H-like HicB family nuclease
LAKTISTAAGGDDRGTYIFTVVVEDIFTVVVEDIFTVVVEPDEDAWHGYCPTLQGYRAATWGSSRAEALRHIREVVGIAVAEPHRGWRGPSGRCFSESGTAPYSREIRRRWEDSIGHAPDSPSKRTFDEIRRVAFLLVSLTSFDAQAQDPKSLFDDIQAEINAARESYSIAATDRLWNIFSRSAMLAPRASRRADGPADSAADSQQEVRA